MDHKTSLTRGAPVGGAATAYIVDEGMPCGTTIAIWAGLLLGALGTGFGAAGYAFSMENKDRLAEMTASSPPPSPSAFSNTACLEQLFGGANTATNTFFPEDTGDYAPFSFSLSADDTTYLAPPQPLVTTSTLSMFMQAIKPVFSTVSFRAGITAYKATVSETSVLSSGASTEQITRDVPLCSSISNNAEGVPIYPVSTCTSDYAWRPHTYQITGSKMATGTGLLNAIGSSAHFASGYTPISGLWVSDMKGIYKHMFKLPVNIKIEGAADPAAAASGTLPSPSPPPSGTASTASTGIPFSFSAIYVQVKYNVYYDTYVEGKDVYATIRYVPDSDDDVVTFNDGHFNSPVMLSNYPGLDSDSGLFSLNTFAQVFMDNLKPIYYTHKINAQCASV